MKALWTIQQAVAHILAWWPSKNYKVSVTHLRFAMAHFGHVTIGWETLV